MHGLRRTVPLVLSLLFLLPVVPVAGMDAPMSINMNVDQEIVRPGDDVGISLYSYSYGYATTPRSATVTVNLESIGTAQDWRAAESLGRIRSQTQTVVTGNAPTRIVWTNLPAGMYRVDATGDGIATQQAVLQVTDLGLVVQEAAAERLVWAIELSTGHPVPGAQIHVGSSMWVTDEDGVAIVVGKGDIRATSPVGPARYAQTNHGFHLDFEPNPVGETGPVGRMFVYTDRPIYRPGQTVHVKVVAWRQTVDGLAAAPGDDVTLSASVWHNGRQERLASLEVPLDSYGAGRADIDLPATAGLGTYELAATWGNSAGRGSFEVQEYRLPGFKVTLSPTASAVPVGSELEVLVAAARFNGAALDQGKVHYSVSGQPRYDSGCYWCEGSSPASSWSGSEESGDLELQGDGTALLRLKTTNPGSYDVRVEVTATNGERIDASLTVEVAQAGSRLSIELPRQGLPAGHVATATMRLTDLSGRALDGHVTINMSNTDTSGDAQTFEVDVKNGVATFDFTPPTAGSYQVQARTTDAAGRSATTTAWFWSAGERDSFAGTQLQLRAERDHAKPGDVVSFHTSSGAAQPILVIGTAGGFLGHQLIHGVGTARFATDGANDADVHALALQVTPTSADNGLFLPDLGQAAASTQLSPHPKGLTVTVTTDRDTYRNGETARILIQVRDAQGNPVQAQVGIAMVDEALLALRQASGATALEAFYPAQGAPYPSKSWNNWGYRGDYMMDIMPPHMELAFAPMAGAGAVDRDAVNFFFESVKATIAVRSYFPETALWLPQLETDEDGVLRLAVPLPDTLTTWKIDAQAITRNGQVGGGTATLATMRNLEVDVYAPRFLVAGDASTIQATVYNHLGEQRDIQVLLVAEGVEGTSRMTRTLSLAPGASGLASFAIEAKESGTAKITFYAWTDGEPAAGDAMERSLPVKPHGTPSVATRSGRGEATVEIEIPANAAEGKGTIAVTVTPTIGNAMVDALPYLTGFPYGCVEQTLSRFLPDVAVARAADRLGIRDRIDSQLDEQVKAGLDRLYGFQHDSGAWGWWTTDDDNEYTTAYTVYGLAVAKQAGYDVDENVLSRGVAALAKMAETSTGALHAYHVFALSIADPARAPAVPDATEPAELAMAILAAHAQGNDAWGRARIGRLTDTGIRSGDLLHWPDPVEGWTSHGMSSDAMVTSLALRAIVAVDPTNQDAGAAVRWLLSNRAGGNWESTKDTAEAIFALVDYLDAAGDSSGAAGALVTVDDKAQAVRFDATSGWAERPPLLFEVGPGTHTVTIKPIGDGPLYWSTATRHFDGGEPITADSGAFTFKREVRNAEGNVVDHVRVGEEANVVVTVKTNRPDARYVQVEDPLPAGAEVVPAEPSYAYPYARHGFDICFEGCGRSMYSWSNAEVHDDRVAFFADSLPEGTEATYRYTIRAIFPGCYHVLPTMAVGMYDSGLAGHGDESSFCIEGPAELQAGRVGVEGEGETRKALVNLYPSQDLPDELVITVVDAVGNEVETVTRSVLPDETGIVRIEVPVPAGDFRLEVEAVDTVLVIRHDETPEPPATDTLFDAAQEATWKAGTVQLAASPLHPGAEPDYQAIFATVPKDALVPAGPATTQVPWPGDWTILALGAALALLRRRDGRKAP